MKPFTSSDSFKPFEHLRTLLGEHTTVSKTPPAVPFNEKSRRFRSSASKKSTPTPNSTDVRAEMSDEERFKAAMADVTPIQKTNRVATRATLQTAACRRPDQACETRVRLQRLVDFGEGFIVAQTPEYMEGTACGVHPEIASRLHNGAYSIQAHIDLHGYSRKGARQVLDTFFQESTTTGIRAVLIVHGRGLSSPSKPVLKPMVYEWLTCGSWRKWVLAFTSARLVDGGAGATYVLLRERPRSKALNKKNNKE